MNEMIDYLANNTGMARFSRGEIRLFLERLDTDGYLISKKPDPVIAQVEPAPEVPAEDHSDV